MRNYWIQKAINPKNEELRLLQWQASLAAGTI